MALKIGDPNGGYGAEILCPACGSNYLHHYKTEVFERNEDATNGLHVVVTSEKASIDSDLAGNPSARRHGLKIHFDCEGCPAKPVLCISQHKGNTYVEFE